jgi:hypothetical protein
MMAVENVWSPCKGEQRMTFEAIALCPSTDKQNSL